MIKLDLNPAPHIIKQFAWFAVIGMGMLAFAVLKFTVGYGRPAEKKFFQGVKSGFHGHSFRAGQLK